MTETLNPYVQELVDTGDPIFAENWRVLESYFTTGSLVENPVFATCLLQLLVGIVELKNKQKLSSSKKIPAYITEYKKNLQTEVEKAKSEEEGEKKNKKFIEFAETVIALLTNKSTQQQMVYLLANFYDSVLSNVFVRETEPKPIQTQYNDF
jgi:hypothetical protein